VEAELQELRGERAFLAALVESLPDFVVRTDLDGRILYVNRLLPGYTRDEVIGRSLTDFTDPAYHDTLRAAMRRVRETGCPDGYESVAAAGDGGTANYYTRLGAIVRGGTPIGYSVVATDVTAVAAAGRELAEHQRRNQLAVLAANIGYWRWDARRDPVTWDEAACAHFGLAPD
jgi:PAS domain S-box-containing protein